MHGRAEGTNKRLRGDSRAKRKTLPAQAQPSQGTRVAWPVTESNANRKGAANSLWVGRGQLNAVAADTDTQLRREMENMKSVKKWSKANT